MPTNEREAMSHADMQEKRAFSQHTAVCRENALFSAIKESHIMYRSTLQRIPLSADVPHNLILSRPLAGLPPQQFVLLLSIIHYF